MQAESKQISTTEELQALIKKAKGGVLSKGDVSAQFELAEFYHFGKGTSIDYAKAIEWYDKAASQGHPSAQYMSGMYYKDASPFKIVKRDLVKAADLFEKAAKQGLACAQHEFALCY